jgi:hypothetical protein
MVPGLLPSPPSPTGLPRHLMDPWQLPLSGPFSHPESRPPEPPNHKPRIPGFHTPVSNPRPGRIPGSRTQVQALFRFRSDLSRSSLIHRLNLSRPSGFPGGFHLGSSVSILSKLSFHLFRLGFFSSGLEMTRLELVTPCMQGKCTTNCATFPQVASSGRVPRVTSIPIGYPRLP